MDIDSPFTMVVLIVLISVGAGVINNWIKTRQNRELDGETQAELDSLRREVARLQDRVKVLEKITTDDEHRLRDEFRNLA